MAGSERESQVPKEPQRIVTDSTSFDIIIANLGLRLFVRYTPEGVLSRVESLTQTEEERLAVETQFTSVVRELLVHSLEYKAAQAAPGSETIGHQVELLDLEKPFKDGVSKLADMQYSNAKIREFVIGQGRLFNSGQEHMGFMPSIVKEEVVKLNQIVDDYFQERARQHTQSRPSRFPSR